MFKQFPINCLKNASLNLDEIINQNKNTLENLLKIDNKTYHNFMRPFMELSVKLNDFFTPIAHINSVNDTEETRAVFSALLPVITDYSVTLSQDERIYKVLKELAKQHLTPIQNKVVSDNIIHFELSGVGSSVDIKNRVKQNSLRLAELSDNFSKNLLDATNDFELILDNDNSFKTMPEIEKAVARQENNKYRFTLLAPSYISFMTYCDDVTLREKVYKAYMMRAENNGIIIEEILKLRYETAKLLGYKNYAELNNVTMSAPNIKAVIEALDTFVNQAKKQAENELEQIKTFAKNKGVKQINSFDTAYFSNLIKKEILDFNEDEYLPYFELNRVIKGLLDFVSDMFGVKFIEITDTAIWHKDVKVFDIIDIKNNDKTARIYFDLITRKEKRGGAWMNNWHTYHYDDMDKQHLPSAFIVANFLPSSKDNPSFLKHTDITTLFHEMGHTLHHLFSKVSEVDISGVNGVEWDAIEFPSQFLELFAYDKSVLKSFAVHHKTGVELADNMIDKLIANRNFQSAMQLLRQVEFAKFDMLIHNSDYKYNEVRQILSDVRKDVAVINPPEYTHFETTFSHIFAGGYASGYYSYKWAEMLSDDVYNEFLNDQNNSKKFIISYKENILEHGAEEKMLDLYMKLMGRKPDPTALLKVNGIICSKP